VRISYQHCLMPTIMHHIKDKMNFDFLEYSGTFVSRPKSLNVWIFSSCFI